MFYRQHPRVYAPVGEVSMTEQSHKDACDIYNILKQYQRTGVVQHIAKAQARFEDLPDSIDYQESLNLIMSAEAAFEALPAKMRAEYQNDPAGFLKALADPANRKRFTELGVFEPERIPVPPDPQASSANGNKDGGGARGGATKPPPRKESPTSQGELDSV